MRNKQAATSHDAPARSLRPAWLPKPKPSPRRSRHATIEFAGLSALMAEGRDRHAFALHGIFVLLVVYTLYFGRAVILPIVLGVFLSFLLQPVVRGLSKLKIPHALGAGIVLFVLLVTVIVGVSRLMEPASTWMQKAPESLKEVERKLGDLLQPAKDVTKAAATVEDMAAGAKDQEVQTVEIKSPGLFDTVLLGTRNVLAGFVITFGLLYFLLASGDFFLRKWVEILPTLTERKRAVAVSRELGATMSTYLATVTVINIALGYLTTMILSVLGMPNPILWGVLSGFLNYIPYLGALIGVIIIGLVALLHFDSVGYALLAPLTYWGLTVLESGFISPIFLGRQLALNPVMIFLSLVFWGWLWGIPGALLAVPILMSLRAVCDYSKLLAPLGKFLGR